MKRSPKLDTKALRPNVAHRSGDEFIGLDVRLLTYFGILALGMLLCFNAAGAFYLYPTGLIFILTGLNEGGITHTKAGLTIGYFLYIALLVATITLPLRKHFRLLVVVMISFMLMNVAGCQIILHGISSIR